MRIALLSGAKAVDGGALKGTAAYVKELAAALAERDHEVHVFTVEGVRRSFYQSIDHVHYHLVSAETSTVSPHALSETASYYLAETRSVVGGFDAVHAHHRALLPALDEIKVRENTRVYLTLHSEAGLANRTDIDKDGNWAHVTIVDGIMASSRGLRDKMSDRLALNQWQIEVIYPGVDQKRYSRWVDQQKVKQQLGFNAGDPLILFVGELARPLGPDLLLEAAFEVLREFPSAKLVYAGAGPMEPYLRQRARVLGMFPSVKLLGFAHEEQIIDLYHACDLVCIPAHSGRLDQTVLESWCAGKPTIVPQSVAPEFLEPHINGLTPKAEVPAIAQDILLLLRQRDFAAQLGERARHKVTWELSWAAIASKCEGIYQQNGNGRKVL